jgi:uncharacterized protein
VPQMTRREVLGAGLAAALWGSRGTAAQRTAGPPLWIVERGSSRVTLFGQMPVRTGDTWLTSSIQQAFDASTELWVENPEPPTTPVPFAPEVPRGPTLVETASPGDLQRIHAALATAGMPGDSLDRLPPSIAYFPIAQLVDRASGADVAVIPERILRARAKAAGKPVHSEWASFEEVSRFLERLSAEQQVRVHLQMIGRALDELEAPKAGQERLTRWLAGDISGVEALDRRMESRYPDARNQIGIERNKAWVPRIQSMLDRTRAAFVCVGILHLAGPESVQAQASRAGLAVRRV